MTAVTASPADIVWVTHPAIRISEVLQVKYILFPSATLQVYRGVNQALKRSFDSLAFILIGVLGGSSQR